MPKPKWLRMEIEGIDIYKNDVRVRYAGRNKELKAGGKRKEVREFTFASRKRLAFVASNTQSVFRWMTTLTYPKNFESDGKVVKSHLNKYLNHIRRNEGGEYLWFIEFQKRGAPHFHVLHEEIAMCPFAARRIWFNIVRSGDWNHFLHGVDLQRIRKPDGARRYAVKYAMKMRQKTVPDGYENVGRFWGHTPSVKPRPEMTTNLKSVRALGDIIGDHEKAREMFERGISVIYNSSPDVDAA